MKKGKDNPGLFGSVMLAYCIVLMHILIVAGLGILVLFFRGVVAYMPLILSAGLLVVCGGTYYLFRYFKSQGKSLRDALNSPLFRGKSVEVTLLGGLASIKINPNSRTSIQPAIDAGNQPLLPGDPKLEQLRELLDLARSLENEHLGMKAAEKAGRNLFH